VQVLAGVYTPHTMRANSTPNVLPHAFSRTGLVTVSTAGANARDPAIALEPRANMAAPTLAPAAHVVWLEGEGTTLMYARVAADGAVSGRRIVASGDRVASPEILVLEEQALGVVWTQQVSGVERVVFARLALATGEPLSLTEITSGGGASEASVASYFYNGTSFVGAIVWVDTRSGARQLLFQRIERGGVLMGPVELVSDAAVAPETPALFPLGLQGFRVVWTDRRDGGRAIYSRDSPLAGGGWAVAPPEIRRSPAGADAHHPRVPLPPVLVQSDNSLYRSVTDPIGSHPLLWETGDSGNRVRFVPTLYLGSKPRRPFPISCASSSGSPDAVLSSDPAQLLPNILGLELGAWVEDGAVVIQALGVRAAVR
jgi:hypothetical protein